MSEIDKLIENFERQVNKNFGYCGIRKQYSKLI